MNPKISVIMAVYNTELFLSEAIESVLKQTYPNFEFIIVDDASTDRSLSIIHSYEKVDNRISVIKNKNNQGAAKARNQALEVALGEYIAIMDSDDICLPTRFEKQLTYLEEHLDIGIIGGQIEKFSQKKGRKWQTALPCTCEAIKFHLLFENPIANPTVMVRKHLLTGVGGYREGLQSAHDKDLWIRLINCTRIENLSETILNYRYHDNQISAKKSLDDRERAHFLSKEFANRYLVEDILDAQWKYLNPYFQHGKGLTAKEIEIAVAIVMRLYSNFKEQETLSKEAEIEIEKIFIDKIISLGRRLEDYERLHHLSLLLRRIVPFQFRSIFKKFFFRH